MTPFSITAYFDDSGTSPENEVAAVGGYLGSKYQWGKFISQWNELLRQYNINVMHRADLENFEGEFKKWNGKLRTEFVRKAHKIIRKQTYIAIGDAVIKEDFEEILPEPVRDFFGGAYGWCVHHCHIAASKWLDKVKHNDPIDWIFEAGTVGSEG